MENKEHDPQEILNVLKELLDLVEPMKKTLTALLAIPDVLKKIEIKEAEFTENSKKLVQEALNSKKAGNQKEALFTLKKKKLIDDELAKLKVKKDAIITKVQVDSNGLLTDPLYEGIKNAIADIKLGNRGRYKKETAEEMNAKITEICEEVISKDDEELLAELDKL